jgi:hypothetical protein
VIAVADGVPAWRLVVAGIGGLIAVSTGIALYAAWPVLLWTIGTLLLVVRR